jgi:hypothetical protein
MALWGIDLGYDMGWCEVTRAGIQSGVVHLRDGNRSDGARLLAMTQWLTERLAKLHAAGERLTEIAYEQITFVGKNDADTLHAHGKQLGNLQRWATLKKQPDPRGIAWDIVKKHVTGQRSASRQTMLATSEHAPSCAPISRSRDARLRPAPRSPPRSSAASSATLADDIAYLRRRCAAHGRAVRWPFPNRRGRNELFECSARTASGVRQSERERRARAWPRRRDR